MKFLLTIPTIILAWGGEGLILRALAALICVIFALAFIANLAALSAIDNKN